MNKAKVFTFLGIVLLLAVLGFASCAAPAAPVEKVRMPSVVEVVPGSVAPSGKVDFMGANFIPGEKVKVVFVANLSPGKVGTIENVVAEGAQKLEINAAGTFYVQGMVAPTGEGVYAVRVYDEKGEAVASSMFLVKKPPAPAK